MTSSMKNAIHRRNHKERAQPLERQKWGLLEKHKDYSLRAKDYNAKKARLRVLRQKAAERNPDEFSFSMLSSTSKQGKKVIDRGNPVLDQQVVKLLKTQDLGYVQTMLQETRRLIDRVEQRILLQSSGINGANELKHDDEQSVRKTVFIDGQEVSDSQQSSPGTTMATRDQVPSQAHSPPKSSADQKAMKRLQRKEERRQKEKARAQKLRQKTNNFNVARLQVLKEREKALRDAEIELDLQRAKMSNSVGGVNCAGVKFRVRERKR